MVKKKPINPTRRKRLERRFNEALQQHQAGNLVAAEKGYRKLIEADPEHCHGLHYLGLILRQRDRQDEAIELLTRASRTPHADATLMNNLGSMLCAVNRREESIPVFAQGVELEPDNLKARLNLAGLLREFGRPQEARGHLQVVLDREPEDPADLSGLGRTLLMLGDSKAAITIMRKALQVTPDQVDLLICLAEALLAQDQVSEAYEVSMRAVALAPNELKALKCQGDIEISLEYSVRAVQTFRKLLEISPKDSHVYAELIHALVGARQEEEALQVCDEAFKVLPNFVQGYLNKGNALKQLGRQDEAVAAYQKAIELDPNCDAAYNNLGMLHMDLGDMQAAQVCFEKALEISPYLPEPLFNLSRMKKSSRVDRTIINKLGKIIDDGSLNLQERIAAHYALGKAYDDCKEYPQAFDHYLQANELKRQTVRFIPDDFRTWVNGFSSTFDEAFFRRCQGFGVESQRPVFIVGMPRSGTTLVEQIVSSHPQVHGGDELTYITEITDKFAAQHSGVVYPQVMADLTAPLAQDMARDYLQRLALLNDTVPRVTDKMPSNYYHLGLIAVLFPQAHIIHCQRDPMDACFSNFIQLFGDGHYYSYSLDDIAVYYRTYRDLMAYWRRVLPLTIHAVRYEELVENQESISRGIIAALGLEWDEACLAFHENQRAVRTASHWQVRQPIYKTARQRWKNYAPFLEKLRQDIGYQEDEPGMISPQL